MKIPEGEFVIRTKREELVFSPGTEGQSRQIMRNGTPFYMGDCRVIGCGVQGRRAPDVLTNPGEIKVHLSLVLEPTGEEYTPGMRWYSEPVVEITVR